MPAQFEEVVVPAYTLHAQHFRPDTRQGCFHITLGRLVFGAGVYFRFRQRLAIHLAVGSERQLVQFNDDAGDHVIRQVLAESFAYQGRINRLPFCCASIGHQASAVGTLVGNRHRFSDFGLRQ